MSDDDKESTLKRERPEEEAEQAEEGKFLCYSWQTRCSCASNLNVIVSIANFCL